MPTNDRRPEHANLWAIIDNPASPQEDIDLAKEIIAEYENREAQYADVDLSIPEKFETRHPDDAPLWAFIDDPEANRIDRKAAFDEVLRRQERRNSQ